MIPNESVADEMLILIIGSVLAIVLGLVLAFTVQWLEERARRRKWNARRNRRTTKPKLYDQDRDGAV